MGDNLMFITDKEAIHYFDDLRFMWKDYMKFEIYDNVSTLPPPLVFSLPTTTTTTTANGTRAPTTTSTTTISTKYIWPVTTLLPNELEYQTTTVIPTEGLPPEYVPDDTLAGSLAAFITNFTELYRDGGLLPEHASGAWTTLTGGATVMTKRTIQPIVFQLSGTMDGIEKA